MSVFASIIAELDAREERQEYLAIMQENTELLLQLISDILDLAKIEAGTLDYNMGYVDVSDFCKDVMRNYDIKEDKAVPVLLAPDLPDYRIYTDKKRLMQVVTNFINNALKFTSEGQIHFGISSGGRYRSDRVFCDGHRYGYCSGYRGYCVRPLCKAQYLCEGHGFRLVHL